MKAKNWERIVYGIVDVLCVLFGTLLFIMGIPKPAIRTNSGFIIIGILLIIAGMIGTKTLHEKIKNIKGN